MSQKRHFERWFGMESTIAAQLDIRSFEYSGENHRNIPGRERGQVYDFVIGGSVPSIIEIKHTVFGNVQPSADLAAAAVDTFVRCRVHLVVVGPKSEAWHSLEPYVSAIHYFDPTEFHAEEEVLAAAEAFASQLLDGLDSAPILERDTYRPPAATSLALRPEAPLLPIARLFGGQVADAVRIVSASFRSIIGQTSFSTEAIDVELGELRREFESGHFTSCALRLGRCLEVTVYAFAHRMGVTPVRAQFESILQVEGKIGHLSRALDSLAASDPQLDPEEYRITKRRLVDAVVETQASLTRLLSEINELATERRVDSGADNVQAILRRAKRELDNVGAPGEARAALSRLIHEDGAREILDFRNAAAHGDPELGSREVGRNEVKSMLIALGHFVQELANIVALVDEQ